MKLIARDEVGRVLAGTELKESGGGLAEQVSDLHEHLHRALTRIDHLTQRVDALEGAKAAARAERGDSDTATPLPESAEPRTTRPRRSSRSIAGKTD